MPTAQSATAARQSTAGLRGRLQEGRRELRQRFDTDGNARRMLRQHCLLIDCTLRSMWKEAALPGSLTLAAVGGYGRGELFPYSDVDILVLLPCEPDAQLKAKLEALIGSLWDAG